MVYQIMNAQKRWRAIKTRDSSADGKFYYGVRTTGVYCRPSCHSRLPDRKNVLFFPTREAAERAGFRACKRCSGPSLREDYAGAVVRACQKICESRQMPRLTSLAKAVGMSPFHFHRIFRKVTGLTPQAYKSAVRNERVRGALRGGKRVTDAIYEAGFNGNSRFYAGAMQALGMKAKDFNKGGEGNNIAYGVCECSLGKMLVAASEKGICAILLGDKDSELIADLRHRFPRAVLREGGPAFRRLMRLAVHFVERPTAAASAALPLDIRGTVFQQKVWTALRDIKVGDTTSYSDIARRIGRPDAVRAVAGAIAANSIAVAVPCHRVLRADGSLCGYRWGTRRKRILLDREKSFVQSDKEQATKD